MTKSAVRRVRRVKTQTQINRVRKSKYKNAIKKMELLLKSKEKEKAKKYFPKFQSVMFLTFRPTVFLTGTNKRKPGVVFFVSGFMV